MTEKKMQLVDCEYTWPRNLVSNHHVSMLPYGSFAIASFLSLHELSLRILDRSLFNADRPPAQGWMTFAYVS